MRAGKQLAKDLAEALEQKRPVFEIPRGVYRLTEGPLHIYESVDFTIRAPGVEMIVECWDTMGRLIGNTNFCLEGVLTHLEAPQHHYCAMKDNLCLASVFVLQVHH